MYPVMGDFPMGAAAMAWPGALGAAPWGGLGPDGYPPRPGGGTERHGRQSRSRGRMSRSWSRSRCRSEEVLRLPRAVMGRVIGKQGANIKDIRERSGTKVEAEEGDDDYCQFRIRGNPRAVEQARAMILEISGKPAFNDRDKKATSSSHSHQGPHPPGPGETTDSLEFPIACTGKIIGRKGAKIHEIVRETGVKVQVDKLSDVCKVHLTGTHDQIDRARILVTRYADDEDIVKPDAAGIVQETMEFPVSCTGKIIGKKGSKIHEAQRETGAKVQVDKEAEVCKVHFTGTVEQITHARAMITAFAEEKDDVRPGLDDETRVLEFHHLCTGKIIGKKGAKLQEIKQESGAKLQVERVDDICKVQIIGTADQIHRATCLVRMHAKESDVIAALKESCVHGGGTGGDGDGDENDIVTENLEYPAYATGGIIGPRGSRIQEVRTQSGAKVQVEKLDDRCRVQLSGTPAQIMRAKRMIRSSVDEEGVGRGHREAEETMEVTRDAIGRIIGRGGETIQRLQRETNCKIDVNTQSDPVRVRLAGSRDAVARAWYMVEEVIEHGDRPSKGDSKGDSKGGIGYGDGKAGMGYGPGTVEAYDAYGKGGGCFGQGFWGQGADTGSMWGKGMPAPGGVDAWAAFGGAWPGLWGPMQGSGMDFPGGDGNPDGGRRKRNKDRKRDRSRSCSRSRPARGRSNSSSRSRSPPAPLAHAAAPAKAAKAAKKLSEVAASIDMDDL